MSFVLLKRLIPAVIVVLYLRNQASLKFFYIFVAGEILISFLKFLFLEFDLKLLTGKIVLSNTNFIKQHEMMGAELELDKINKVV